MERMIEGNPKYPVQHAAQMSRLMCEEGILASWALMHLIREDVIGRRTRAGECCAWTCQIPHSSTFM